MYGLLARQPASVQHIAATCRATLRRHVRTTSFISHDLGEEYIVETATQVDAAQLALWLARAGYTEFLDDAERIVRTRILPSQVTELLELRPRSLTSC